MHKINFLHLSFFVACASSLMAEPHQQTNLPLSFGNIQNNSSAEATKMLQNEALIQTDSLLRYLQQIGLRLEKLKIDKALKKEVQETVSNIREKLEQMKIKHTLHINDVQLSQFITIIQALTQAVEVSLKQSFNTVPTINSKLIKRSQSTKASDPLRLKKRLEDNAKRLKDFDRLISIMNLNYFQRGYRIASDAWNTPLYTFEMFGKSDLYMSSILKRAIIYPATLSCMVYSVKQNVIDAVPFEPLRNALTDFKKFLGKNPFKQNRTHTVEYPLQIKEGTPETPYKETISEETGEEILSPKGAINAARYLFNWAIEPDLEVKFTLPIAGYLTSYVYKDLESAKTTLPYVASYVHNKLRGEDVDVMIPGQFQTPKETFEDVVGRDGIKLQLQPFIDFVINPLTYIQSGIKLPRGVMFTGEPQTGKTLMIKALCGEITKQLKLQGINRPMRVLPVSVPFIKNNGLDYCMAQAKRYAPCILFCDEFDLLQAQRDKDAVLLSTILEGLNGYHTSSDLKDFVIFMIATNRPEHLDFAVTEPGRCGKTIYFENPTLKERKAYFETFYTKKLIDIDTLDIENLSQETEACSYGSLVEIANASLRIAQRNSELLQQKHIDQALNSVVRNIVEEGYDIPQEQKDVLSARYASQAFASLALDPTRKLTGVTIYKITEKIKEKDLSVNHYTALQDRSGHSGIKLGGIFSYNKKDIYNLVSEKDKVKEIKIIVAGAVGQEVLGVESMIFPEDELKALELAQEITFKGINEKMYPKSVREEKKLEAYLLVQQCKEEMAELLGAKKEGLEKVAKLLQRRSILRTSDIKRCLGAPKVDLMKYFASRASETTEEEVKELIETPEEANEQEDTNL